MTSNEINKTIAEALGWTHVYRATRKGKADPNGVCMFGHDPQTCEDSVMGREHVELPDYAGDLNAIHAAEAIFTPTSSPSQWDYSRELYSVVVPIDQQPFRATARQRAEAWLRVKGLWREEGKV